MHPPFEITATGVAQLARIERLLGRYEGTHQPRPSVLLRKELRVRTVQGSVAIEGNTLTEDQISAVFDGKRVLGPRREILEVRNALAAYDKMLDWRPENAAHLLAAHGVLMHGLLDEPGKWRRKGVGILRGDEVIHVAPPAKLVAGLVQELLRFYVDDQKTHPLAKAAVVHCELEFIHPFEDGNGRIGRLWHSLIAARYHPLFQYVPIESVIRDRQAEYYEVLNVSNQAGHSTAFVEFALAATYTALESTLKDLAPIITTAEHRLANARDHFGNNDFTRKDYLKLFPNLSSATASRDLKAAVDGGDLRREGEKARARYRYIG